MPEENHPEQETKGSALFKAIARFIRRMVARPTTKQVTTEPNVDLESFLKNIDDRADLPMPCYTYAVVLLKHLAEKYVGKITPHNIIRVTFASIIVAAGMLQDRTYNLDTWAVIGKDYYSGDQLCALQTQFLQSLGYDVHVKIDEYVQVNNDLLVCSAEVEAVNIE